ncbi:MAG: hypothetical protein ACI9EF_003006 [Pseudohongiellaceae bacterium]|jgi:hypothetical protein
MGRRRPNLACSLLLAVLAGCASPPGGTDPVDAPEEERVVREIETIRSAQLLPWSAGLATEATLEVSLRPRDPVTLEILGIRPEGEDFGDGLLEVELRWKDFVGTEPTSFGGSQRTTVPFGADGIATRETPFVRQWSFQLPEPDKRVLARRVQLKAKLHPVDVLTTGARSAGRTLEMDGVIGDSFVEIPADFVPPEDDCSLAEVLADATVKPSTIFLMAVGAGSPNRDLPSLVGAAVMSLEEARSPQRDALFGALQFMTDQTQGRSVARWQLWWSHQEASANNNL